MLRRFAIYPNVYYNYLKNRKQSYREQKASIQRKIVELYHQEHGIPGYRMMCDYLKQHAIVLSSFTIHKYMKELGLQSIVRRKKPGYVKGKVHQVFPNLLNQEFHVSAPNKVWCTDFTYLPQKDGSMRYNCTILDLYDRSIVATKNSHRIDAQLAIDTLELATMRHKPNKGLILHSDQGRQFAAHEFHKCCNKHHIQQSMSRAGCPYDNAPMERFYNTLKHEFFNLYRFRSMAELDQQMYEFIYVKYNYQRPHSYNKGLTPYAARYAA